MYSSRLNNRELTQDGDGTPPDAYADAFQNGHVPPLRELVRILLRRLWIIVVSIITLAGIVVGLELMQTPVYQTSIKILVGQEEKSSTFDTSLGSEAQGLKELTPTMTEGVATRPIAEAVISDLDLQTTPDDLLKNLKAEQVRATQFINVTYEDTDPRRAQRVVNSVGEAFSDYAATVSPSVNSLTATVWEPAQLPEEPVRPNPLRDGVVGLAVGALLGVALAFLLEYLDDRWRSPEEVERVSGSPIFGVIPDTRFEPRKKERSGLVTSENQRPPNPK
jgi:capsular polysaccharide biosynthesis protein